MIDVAFDIQLTGDADAEDRLLDDYELQAMLDHTRAQINQHVQDALADLRCEEHGEPARVTISGTYNTETDQLDVSYNIDTCCKLFLMRAITALNR
jgi:hypothetical protein